MAPAKEVTSWKWWTWKSKRRLKFWTNACLIAAGATGLALAWFHGGNVTISIAWNAATLATGSVLGFLFGIPGRSNAPRPPAIIVAGGPTVVNTQPAEPTGTPAPTPSPTGTVVPGSVTGAGVTGVNPAIVDPDQPGTVSESNLVQVSDWVTKLLLGGGLTQLQEIPGKIWELAGWVAIGIDPEHPDPKDAHFQANQVFASGLLVYFFVLGFFGGYFITQLQFGKKIRF
jgi:hypothetical protein